MAKPIEPTCDTIHAAFVRPAISSSSEGTVPTPLDQLNRFGVPIAYIIAILLIAYGSLPSNPRVGLFHPNIESASGFAPFGYVTKTAPPLYPLFFAFLMFALALVFWTLAKNQLKNEDDRSDQD